MKLILRVFVCFSLLAGSVGLFVHGLYIKKGMMEFIRSAYGLPFMLFSIALFIHGSILAVILFYDFRYIKKYNYKSFCEVTKNSSVHRVIPLFRIRKENQRRQRGESGSNNKG